MERTQKAEIIANWLIEEAKKTEIYNEYVQEELFEAVVGFDWEEIENEFGRLDSEDRAEILYRLEAYHNVYTIENGGNEPDFDLHFDLTQ